MLLSAEGGLQRFATLSPSQQVRQLSDTRVLSGRGVLVRCPAFSSHGCISRAHYVTVSQATFLFHVGQEKKE